MKNHTKYLKKHLLFAGIFIFSAISFGFVEFNKETTTSKKITICHVPPGNPDNCHEIKISKNALQAHLNHGDRLVCYNQRDLIDALDLLNVSEVSVVRDILIINF